MNRTDTRILVNPRRTTQAEGFGRDEKAQFLFLQVRPKGGEERELKNWISRRQMNEIGAGFAKWNLQNSFLQESKNSELSLWERGMKPKMHCGAVKVVHAMRSSFRKVTNRDSKKKSEANRTGPPYLREWHGGGKKTRCSCRIHFAEHITFCSQER